MIERPPFPSVFDSTIIASMRACFRKMELEYMWHYKPKSLSVHLHAGASFARGLEVARDAFWVKGLSAPEAVIQGLGALIKSYGDFECPPDSAKSLERTAAAFEYCMEVFPLGGDGAEPILLPSGRRGIEFSFSEPLPIDHPETGEPLIYCGRADQIVNYAGGIYVEDDKTTSQLGPSWPRQWDLRSQFTGYTWACRRNGIAVNGVLVRGLAILKTKFNQAEALTYRPEWQIDRWYEQVLRDIKRLMKSWEEGYYDFNLDHACEDYGGCPFKQVCLMKEPQPILDQFFEQRKWDPILRTETKL